MKFLLSSLILAIGLSMSACSHAASINTEEGFKEACIEEIDVKDKQNPLVMRYVVMQCNCVWWHIEPVWPRETEEQVGFVIKTAVENCNAEAQGNPGKFVTRWALTPA